MPIPLPEPKERGYWKFEVTFALDHNGLLHITVKRMNDGEVFKVDVQCNVRSKRGELAKDSEHLKEVMAPADGGPERGTVPPPPIPETRPEIQTEVMIEPPAADTPAEFKSIARRSYKLLQQPMEDGKRTKLRTAYAAFSDAVKQNSANVEDLGDALGDVYIECR